MQFKVIKRPETGRHPSTACVCVCVLQVPVTVASASAIPKTGGCLESTVNVTTESATNTMASSAQVNQRLWKHKWC